MDKITTLLSLIGNLKNYEDYPATIIFQRKGNQIKTYRELSEDIDRLSCGLQESGMKQGQNIALLSSNCYEWIVTCLGAIKVGGVIVPIDIQHDEKILEHILKDSEAQAIFTTSDQFDRLQRLSLPSHKTYLFDVPEQDQKSWQKLFHYSAVGQPQIRPQDSAVLFYTSGTTGFPKGVPLTHANLAFQLNMIMETRLVEEGERLLMPLPLHHVYPFVIGMLTPLAFGIPIVFPQSVTGPQIIRALREGEVTIVIGVPGLYRALYEGIASRLKTRGKVLAFFFNWLLQISLFIRRLFGLRIGKTLFFFLHREFGEKVRIMGSGGAALDPDLHWKLEALGWQVTIGYGLTETSPLLTMNLPETARIGSVGQACTGVEIRLDQEGEILARGPGIFSGYRHLPEETKKSFTKEGWFRTADLGYFDRERYLYITGRVSTVIVTESGKNIQPEAVEEAYQKDTAIREIGILEKEGKLVAVILPDENVIQQQGLQIDKAVREAVVRQSRTLPSYQRISSYVLTRESLPRTRLGKIRRYLLADSFNQATKQLDQYNKPISYREMSDQDRTLLDNPDVRKLWVWLTTCYHDHRLTPNTRLQLDLGMDSLGWVDLTLEIAQRIGIELPEDATSRIETVRDLLSEVAGQSSSKKTFSQTMIMQQPEEVLNEHQKKWLKPYGIIRKTMAFSLFGLAWLIMKGIFRLRVQGLEHLPRQGPFVITPNHVSYLDPPAIGAALGWAGLRQTYWAGWTGVVFINAFMRSISRLAQVVPIDPLRAGISSLAFGAAVLKQGKNLVWFPEGQRSSTGKLMPFKMGLGILLTHWSVPVVPVEILGSYEAWPVHQKWPRPHPITVVFKKPLEVVEIKKHAQGDKPQEMIMRFLYDHMQRNKDV